MSQLGFFIPVAAVASSPMPDSSNLYRADQVGSFLRSHELKEAQAAYQQGTLSLEQLREVEDREILRVLDMQKQVGIDVVSDGEFRRGGWASDFQEAMEGYVPGAPPVVMSWHSPPGATATAEAPAATAGSGHRQSRHWREVVTKASPDRARVRVSEAARLRTDQDDHARRDLRRHPRLQTGRDRQGLREPRDVLRDAASIIDDELAALVPTACPTCSSTIRTTRTTSPTIGATEWRALGVDADQALADDIAADNASIAGLDRARVTIGMHLCRGNGRSVAGIPPAATSASPSRSLAASTSIGSCWIRQRARRWLRAAALHARASWSCSGW